MSKKKVKDLLFCVQVPGTIIVDRRITVRAKDEDEALQRAMSSDHKVRQKFVVWDTEDDDRDSEEYEFDQAFIQEVDDDGNQA